MLLQMGPLLHLGPVITLVPSTDERSNQIATRLYIRDLKIRRRGRQQRERQKSNRF